MNLASERESILEQEATAIQKAHMFINRALELQLDLNEWQTLVWTQPGDMLDAWSNSAAERYSLSLRPACHNKLFAHYAWCF